MKEHKKRPHKLDEDALGTVIEQIWKGKQYLFVIIQDETGDQFEIFDSIVHESVHVWQLLRSWVGENPTKGSPPDPATEIEAYSIAYIAKTLLKDFSNAVSDMQKLSD
jgi:hypothetical protein